MTRILSVIALSLFLSSKTLVFASENSPESGRTAVSLNLIEGEFGESTSLDQALERVHTGDIVVLGEMHNSKSMQAGQVAVIEALCQKGLKVSVGMEFFDKTQQPLVDQYLQGSLTEVDFLKSIGWGGFDYAKYKTQVRLPLQCGGTTVGLNAPRSLTSKVAKTGLASLNDSEKNLLPPDFEIGNELYFKRFSDLMSGGHIPDPAVVLRYFQAQSIWDDTMAFEALKFMKSHSDHVLVIIVGGFHVDYGGGVPDRIQTRLPLQSLLTFSFVNLWQMTDEEKKMSLQPDDTYGIRADYLGLYDFDPDLD